MGRISLLIGADQVGPYTLDDISILYANINCAKNDTEGHGHRMPFPKLDLEFVDTDAAFCLCTETFLLAKRLKLTPTSPFFSSPKNQEDWALTAEVLNFYLRKAASEGFQIHSKKISSRSLRIGAASAMASANLPDYYVIQKVGRWKSLVFLQYIRLARGAFKSA